MAGAKEKIFEEGKKRWALTGTEKEFYRWLIKAISLITKTINGSPITTETEGEDMPMNDGGNPVTPYYGHLGAAVGTNNYIQKVIDKTTNTLGDSQILDDGTIVSVLGTQNSPELAPVISSSTWTADTAKGWSIVGDHIVKVANGQYSATGAYPVPNINAVTGKLYKISFTVNSITYPVSVNYAAFSVNFGTTAVFMGLGTGSRVFYIRALGTGGISFANRSNEAATASIDISDISIKEVIEGNVKIENNLEVNGTLRINNSGGNYLYPSLEFYKQGDPNYARLVGWEESLAFYIGTSNILTMSTSGFLLPNNTAFGWNTAQLQRDADNVIATRRYGSMASPQEFRIYNKYTNTSTDYERLSIKAVTGGAYVIGAEAAGTGTVRDISLMGGNVGIGTTTPAAKLDVAGAVKVGNDSAVASASNAGAIRYRADANNSYCEMVMQTGASTYAWVIINQNTW